MQRPALVVVEDTPHRRAIIQHHPAGLALRARTRWYREDPSGGGRIELWRDTLSMSARRWLAGSSISVSR